MTPMLSIPWWEEANEESSPFWLLASYTCACVGASSENSSWLGASSRWWPGACSGWWPSACSGSPWSTMRKVQISWPRYGFHWLCLTFSLSSVNWVPYQMSILMLYLGNLPDTLVNLVVYHREQRKDHVASSVDLYPYAKWQQKCCFN